MGNRSEQSSLISSPPMALFRCARVIRLFVRLAVVQGVLLLIAGSAQAAATGTKQKEYPQDFETVWAATMGALQGHGDPIIFSDKVGGTITTDFKAEEDQDWRHKFNLLLVRNGDEATSISVTCTVENHRQSHSFNARSGLTWEDAKSDGTRETQLLDAITRRLQPGGAAAETSDSNCRANFSIKGSVVRGTTYMTFDEFQGLTQMAAIDALIASLGRESFAILSTDKNAGVIRATRQPEGGKPRPLDFSVVPISGGARVSVVQKLHPGDRGHDDDVRDQFCKVIGSVAEALPKPSPRPPKINSPSKSVPGETVPIEDRLRKLDELYKKGLITEEEYKKKRAELLSKL